MIEAVLNLKVRNNWIADVSKEYPVRIRILDCIPFAKEGRRALLEIYNVNDLNKFTTEILKNLIT